MRKIICWLIFCGVSQPAVAFIGYLKGYQFGIDYTTSIDHVDANYRTELAGAKDCEPEGAVTDTPRRYRCRVSMAAGRSSGYGIFLEQAFKRQGLLYVKPDIGFGLRYLQGDLPKPTLGQPLKQMSFQLLAMVIKPYLKLGITPLKNWPDLFLSVGPTLIAAAGYVSVNSEKVTHGMVGTSNTPISGFLELEAVFARFGDGYFSLFTSTDYSGGKRGSKFYPKEKDGMDDFRATFKHEVRGDGRAFGLGAKLLLNWP